MESIGRGVLDPLGSQNKCNTCYGVVVMGQCYCQLSLEERIEIYRLHAAGESMRTLANSMLSMDEPDHKGCAASSMKPFAAAPCSTWSHISRRSAISSPMNCSPKEAQLTSSSASRASWVLAAEKHAMRVA